MSLGSGFNPFSFGSGGGGNPLNRLLDPFGKQAGADAARDAANAESAGISMGIDEQRRQFDAVQALLAPFVGAGTGALPGLTAGATVGGFDERIKQILGSDTFSALLGDRTKAVGNQLASAGLMRSGHGALEAAKIPTDLALAIEEALYGRSANLAGMGQASATGQAQIGTGLSANIAQLLGQRGASQAGGIIGGQQAQAAVTGNLMNAGIALASIFFSDPRMKENMAPIGKIGPLTLYEWDWKKGISRLIGRMNIGFDAEQVEKHFPQHTVRVHGFLAVDYPALTATLREQFAHG